MWTSKSISLKKTTFYLIDNINLINKYYIITMYCYIQLSTFLCACLGFYKLIILSKPILMQILQNISIRIYTACSWLSLMFYMNHIMSHFIFTWFGVYNHLTSFKYCLSTCGHHHLPLLLLPIPHHENILSNLLFFPW